MSAVMRISPDVRAAERTLILVRWFVVAFLIAQVFTERADYPGSTGAWAAGIAIAYGVANAAIWFSYVTWPSPSAMRRLSVISMAVDMVALLGFIAANSFSSGTSMFAIMYLLPMAAAIRFSWSAALVIMGITAVGFAGIAASSASYWGYTLQPVDVVLPIAIGFLVAGAAAASSLCHQHEKYLVGLEADSLRDQDDAKNTFLHAVSHDLRTPLTTILGFAITLEDHAAELTPAHREMLRHLATEATTLDRLLSDLLDLDRLTRGSIEIVPRQEDVTELVRGVCDNLSSKVGRTIVVDGPATLTAVDGMKVERIVENLVGNAIKYSPDGSVVRVAVEHDTSQGGVLIQVDDSGPGIPAAQRDSLFQPYERAEDTASWCPGSGIGLSIVQRFTAMHGGRVWVEDSDTGGASFRVWLPDAAKVARPVTAHHSAAPRVSEAEA